MRAARGSARRTMMFAALLGFCGARQAHGYVMAPWRTTAMPRRSCRATVPCLSLPSDADLFASLRARVEKSESKSGMPPPLGPDEVGAESMGPTDVVEYCMKSLLAHVADGTTKDGCRVLMAFAVKVTDGKAEDFVGQVQPGCGRRDRSTTAPINALLTIRVFGPRLQATSPTRKPSLTTSPPSRDTIR